MLLKKIKELEIKIDMMKESDLKGELDDNELSELDTLEIELKYLKSKSKSQSMPKQVIVVNRNLNMPSGKLAAQVSHASLGALLQCGIKDDDKVYIDLSTETAYSLWLNGSFTKIVLYVKSNEKLLEIYKKCQDKKLPSVLITDAGHTQFNGIATNTCVGIGPVFPEDLIGITDKLRVL